MNHPAQPAPPRERDFIAVKASSSRDIGVLRACVRALNRSTSRRMLAVNLAFLNDRFLAHPSESLPNHLKQ